MKYTAALYHTDWTN